ncbi:MAG: pantetheine-phosphate adenylyltransferase [Oscillospiraceae bacterium]|jgi:pantetheine-phosphate adenylyltransferase|nr:pantetheine-phosphate adenylyltransferase [Oscillospiraceae bacterium]
MEKHIIKKAIYPGSFDPFTNGHLDIVKKSAALFDEVYVLIGINATKKRAIPSEEMKAAIEATVRELDLDNVRVVVFEGLVAQYAAANGIQYMIRGLRNNMDYNYEENIAEVNKLINPAMEYVYFRAENVAVSSSMVKELHSYGQDVSVYLPKPVFDIL